MKQLVLLVIYIPVKTKPAEVKHIKEAIRNVITKELQDETNTTVRCLVMSTKGDYKAECIFPKEYDENILQKLEELENLISK